MKRLTFSDDHHIGEYYDADEVDAEIATLQAEVDTLQSFVNCALDFIDQNEATFDRMEVAEYDTLVDSAKPYRSKAPSVGQD